MKYLQRSVLGDYNLVQLSKEIDLVSGRVAPMGGLGGISWGRALEGIAELRKKRLLREKGNV